MSQIEKIDNLLNQTLTESSNVEGLAVVDREGVIITYNLPEEVDAERVVSVCVSIFRVSQMAAEELGRGSMDHAYVKGKEGTVLFTMIDENLILITLARKSALLGTVLNEVKQLTLDLNKLAG